MKEQFQEKFSQPETVEEAVTAFVDTNDARIAIDYLKVRPDDIAEFCLQVYESFKEGDKTGIVLLAKVIKNLLEDSI